MDRVSPLLYFQGGGGSAPLNPPLNLLNLIGRQIYGSATTESIKPIRVAWRGGGGAGC